LSSVAALGSVREIQRELGRPAAADQAEPGTGLRTSVLTHIAWVPGQWREAAEATLAGLGEAHPSRTLLLFPEPDSPENGLEARVDRRRFPRGHGRPVCSEVVSIELRGDRSARPASVVMPLLRSDLPAFLRWRGELPFGAPELEQLVDLADRLIVDSREWQDPAASFAQLPELFPRIAVSDVAWSRLLPWREALARLWPGIADVRRLRVRAPAPEALLLAGWLGARLQRNVVLERESAGEIELVEADGDEVRPDRLERRSPSDLLSAQLEVFGRDPIYEEAVCNSASPTISSP
jgi:glucose-6-phosphate dehydrogenase assembly protein OpcA